MDFYDTLRLINAGLSLVIFLLALLKAPMLFPRIPVGRRLVHVSHALIIVTVGFIGANDFVRHDKGNYLITTVTVVMIISLVAYLWPDPPVGWMTRKK